MAKTLPRSRSVARPECCHALLAERGTQYFHLVLQLIESLLDGVMLSQIFHQSPNLPLGVPELRRYVFKLNQDTIQPSVNILGHFNVLVDPCHAPRSWKHER